MKKIRQTLELQFGFTEKLNYVFLMNNEDKIYVTNRDIADIELDRLRIDFLGLCFGKLANDGIRLTIEGSQIIGPLATKSIIELDGDQFEEWLKGRDIEIKNEGRGIMLIKHEDEFIGCGILKNEKLLNQIPKIRRLVNINN